MSHSIRLREPWKRIDDKSGGWVFSRTFNSPTGIQPGQPIELHIRPIENIRPSGLQLNEVALALTPRDELFIADMADRLQSHNRLLLRLEWNHPAGERVQGQQSSASGSDYPGAPRGEESRPGRSCNSLASGSDSPAPSRAIVEPVQSSGSSSAPDLTQLADVRILLF